MYNILSFYLLMTTIDMSAYIKKTANKHNKCIFKYSRLFSSACISFKL